MIRSWLFIPGDSQRKIEKALSSGADALIFDLEDSVSADNKAAARRLIAEVLRQSHEAGPLRYVRINPLQTELVDDDLAAVMGAAPDGVVLPKCAGHADLETLSHKLDEFETRAGLPPGSTRIVPIATETAAAMFGLASYARKHPRLEGLMWGAEDLAADIGALTNRGDDGQYLPPFQLARSLCLLAAVAAEATPIDAVFTAFKDLAGLEAECQSARQIGYSAKAAIHPDQIAVINRCFTPSTEEIAWALRIVDAFKAAPDAGVLSIEGKMIDKPHLLQALRVLSAAGDQERHE